MLESSRLLTCASIAGIERDHKAEEGDAVLAGRCPCPDVAEVSGQSRALRRDRERGRRGQPAAPEGRDERVGPAHVADAERRRLVEAIQAVCAASRTSIRSTRAVLASFEVVNNHLQHMLPSCSGRHPPAAADRDGDDPVEAGLEIVAKPPGKKRRRCRFCPAAKAGRSPPWPLIFAVFSPTGRRSVVAAGHEGRRAARRPQFESYCDCSDEMTRSTRHAQLRHHHIKVHKPDTMARAEPALRRHHGERGSYAVVSVDLEGAVQAARGGVIRGLDEAWA